MIRQALLAASLLSLVPVPACAQAAVAVATLPHISITAIGTGPTVVLIPGLASPRAVWNGVSPMIARRHRVVLVQVNGFAGDDAGANLAPGLLDGVVTDLHGYLAASHLSHAAVIGHSMGGLLGLMLARAHPGDVGRLMLVDALPFFGAVTAPALDVSAETVRPLATAMRDRVAARYGQFVDPASTAADVNGLALKPGSRAAMLGWAGKVDPRVTAEALYEDMTTDLRADLAGMTTPITLVYPWSAGGVPQARVDAFYRRQFARAPHMTYLPVADSGHFVMLDQPAAFAVAVQNFVGG